MSWHTPPNCTECGRFVSWDRHVQYTRYGSSYDVEPSDPCYVHIDCWDKMEKKSKELTASVCWHKPVYFIKGKTTPCLKGGE